MKKFLLTATLIMLALGNEVARANTIKIYCPSVDSMTRSKGSIYAYKYTGETYVDLAALNNSLTLSGEGNSDQLIALQAATWTDQTFLCNYKGNQDVVVAFETVLAPYVTRCWFPGNMPECLSSDPDACPMLCELNAG